MTIFLVHSVPAWPVEYLNRKVMLRLVTLSVSKEFKSVRAALEIVSDFHNQLFPT